MEPGTIERTPRQLKEIHLALLYVNFLGAYGTDGHNRLVLIASDATERGFHLDFHFNLVVPEGIVTVEEPRRG